MNINRVCNYRDDTYGFLNWSRSIESMALQNIDIIKLQTLEAMLYSVKDVLCDDQSAYLLSVFKEMSEIDLATRSELIHISILFVVDHVI